MISTRTVCSSASLLLGVVGLVAIAVGTSIERGRPNRPPPPPPLAAGQSTTVDIGTAAAVLPNLPAEERPEQWRDWGVYGVVPRIGAQPDELKPATYRMPPVRFPYLRDLYVFEYGYGRKLYVGERVLLFYDVAAPDRQAVVGRLADLVRMETGETKNAEIYAMKIDSEHGQITVSREPDVVAADPYGRKYGYIEAGISNREEFATWLNSIDDVTYANVTYGHTTLGGRRFEKSRTRGIDLEQVAALYQANAEVSKQRTKLQATLDGIEAQVNREYNAELRGSRAYERIGTESKYQKILDDRIAVEMRKAHIPPAPGFSLDPQFMRTTVGGKIRWKIATDLRQLANDPCGTYYAMRSQARGLLDRSTADDSARPTIEWNAMDILLYEAAGSSMCAQIPRELIELARKAADEISTATEEDWEERFVPFYELLDKLDHSEGATLLMHDMVKFVMTKDQLQCARYDGPARDEPGALQGTTVGMNLFYTDVLAKLWVSVDYHRSAPLDVLPGMLTGPRTKRYPTFIEEERALPHTRLWFGPRADAVAKLDDDSLAFRHIATRVYAAGSNPLHPGKEDKPRESARRRFSWWDRHYEEVADHEPQYHVQNQIMKWSLITARMAKGNVGFLASVPVDRTHRFDAWMNEHASELRYQHPITLRPQAEWPNQTECMDLLTSYPFRDGDMTGQISGGVSLGGEQSLDALAHVSDYGTLGTRFRPTKDIGAGNAGTAWRAWPELESTGGVAKIIDAEGAQISLTRAGDAELKLGKSAELRVEATADGGLRAGVGGDAAEIGSLSASLDADKVVLSWTPRDAEAAHSVARRAAAQDLAEAPDAIVAGHGSPIVLGEGSGVIVPTAGEHSALLITPRGETRNYVAVAGDKAVANLDGAELGKHLDGFEWQQVALQEGASGFDTSGAIVRKFTSEGPSGSARKVALKGASPDGTALEAFVDDKAVWIRRPNGEQPLTAWRSLDRNIDLRPSTIDKIKKAQGEVSVAAGHDIPRVSEAVASGDYSGALLALDRTTLDDPKALARTLDGSAQEVTARARLEIAHGNIADAAPLHELAGDFMKQSPDSLLQDVLSDLGLSRPQSALSRVDSVIAKGVGSPAELEQFEVAMQRAGAADVADLVASSRGLGTIDSAALPHMKPFVAGDGRLGVRYRTETPLATVKSPERAIARDLNATSVDVIYIDDRLRLSREGAEAELDPAIGAWARDDHQVWKEAPSVGTYPMVIEDAGVTYSRVTRKAGAAVPPHGGRILLITRCDESSSRDCKE